MIDYADKIKRGDMTLAEAHAHAENKGKDHRAYGWAPYAAFYWPESVQTAYMRGYTRANTSTKKESES